MGRAFVDQVLRWRRAPGAGASEVAVEPVASAQRLWPNMLLGDNRR